MKDTVFHSWQADIKQAKVIQETLAKKIIISRLPSPLAKVAGFDVSYFKGRNILIGGMVIMNFPTLEVIHTKVKTNPISFPYVPGYLSFREAPVILDLIAEIKETIDVYIFDGHGQAHPRGLGIAAHIGVWIDRPCVGCAKKKLVGDYDQPDNRRGAHGALIYKGQTIGSVLRTKPGVKPVFVSIGHRTNLPESIDLILSCCTKYRIPEPLRQAHQLVTAYRKELEKTLSDGKH
jgi:deoxyribonuclease V